MVMPMVDVRKVRVGMAKRRVYVFVHVGVGQVQTWRMRVLMMHVMSVRMGMRQRLMNVLVSVGFCYMEPDPGGHTGATRPEQASPRLPIQKDGDKRPDERRCGEISARPGRSELAQRHDEEHQAEAIADETEQQRRCEVTP